MKGPTVLTEFKGKCGTCLIDLSQVVALETVNWPLDGDVGTRIYLKSGQTIAVKKYIQTIKEKL